MPLTVICNGVSDGLMVFSSSTRSPATIDTLCGWLDAGTLTWKLVHHLAITTQSCIRQSKPVARRLWFPLARKYPHHSAVRCRPGSRSRRLHAAQDRCSLAVSHRDQ